MKHSIVLLLLGFFLTPSVTAVDWGGSLSTTSLLQSVEEGSDLTPFVNTQRLTMFLNTPLGARWRFEAQGAVLLNGNPQLIAADLERFYVQRRLAPNQGSLQSVTTRYGRQRLTDPAGVYLNQVVDGVALTLRYPRFTLAFAGGYTGLINKEFGSASLTLRDSLDLSDTSTVTGPSRLIGQARGQLPNVLLGQNLSFAFTFQEDLRDPSSVVQPGTTPDQVDAAGGELGGLLDTQYLQIALDGAIPLGEIPGNLFYQGTYVLNTGQTLSLISDETVDGNRSFQYRPILAHLVQMEAQYFLPQFYSTAAGVSLSYSTGDTSYESFVEGNTSSRSTMFTPISSGGSGLVFSLDSGNATIVELFYSMRPLQGRQMPLFDTMQVQASWLSFFRSAGTGAVSSGVIDSATERGYLGSEIDLAVRLRPLSDVGVGLSGGLFFANSEALADGAPQVSGLIRLDGSISF